MITALLITASFLMLMTIIGFVLSGPRYKGPVSDHFDGKVFINPGGRRAKGLLDVFKWTLSRRQKKWKKINDAIPGEKPTARVDTGVRITFVNHSTFLIQFDGLNILTDPVWSNRASPFSWAGPKRMRAPGIRLEDLPKIDFILLSHNHYDHLDVSTLKKLVKTHQPKIITALGVKTFLDKRNITGSFELDWWDEFLVRDSTLVQAVPAQHFSGRGTLDRDATLWCGFVIRRSAGAIYFAGDTGYNAETFKEIGERCAPIDIALVPIGAYNPVWFMSPIHCSPEEAVRIHQDSRAQISIASHFGTFPLADDGFDEPVNDLQTALQSRGISSDRFLVLKEGVSQLF